MNVTVELNGNWKVSGRGPGGERIEPIDAVVPGHVHNDLLRAGLIPDPMWRDQALDVQWVEAWDWTYETEFEWEADTGSAHIRFEGLDTVASVWLNGVMIGSARNMFIAHVFPASEALVRGRNRLEVRFVSVPSVLADTDKARYVSLFSQDRVYLRRMQCTFGWDWVHRLVSYGVWRPVRIEAKPRGEIVDVAMRTLRIDGDSAALQWEAEAALREPNCTLQLRLVGSEGEAVWERTAALDASGKSAGEVTLEGLRLWWPVGYGAPHLYRLESRLLWEDGETLDMRSDEIGIRTVEIEQIPDAQGSSFTIVVNGKRIFAKGGNWVPADPFPSAVADGKYGHLLQTLVDGSMNMLRVWGGGTYELPAFWAHCNRLGIMVSVDFMMACAQYPEHEPWFLDEMAVEVESAIKQLRNHPSLVFWCGDNELAMNSNPEDDYWGKHVCAQVTEPACGRLDPARPFFPTSPYLGRPFNSQDEGDCHFSSWYDVEFMLGDLSDYRERIAGGRGRFLSECAVLGAPPLPSLLHMMTMEDIEDPSAAMWEFRTKDNPYNGQDELTHHRMIEKTAHALFGESVDTALRVNKLGYVQYEFARLQGEHYRRRKYVSSGVLFWMYNDCWPASGCSMVTYDGMPKAGYYGAKKAFQPLLVSLEDRGEEVGVWLVNDTLRERTGEIVVRAVRTDGTPLFERTLAAAVPANDAVLAGAVMKREAGVAAGANDVVVEAVWRERGTSSGSNSAEAAASGELRAIYFDVLPKELTLPQARLHVEVKPTSDTEGVIVIGTDAYARVVTIEGGGLLPEDNYFDMMPGERRVMRYRSFAAGEPVPRVTCWNG